MLLNELLMYIKDIYIPNNKEEAKIVENLVLLLEQVNKKEFSEIIHFYLYENFPNIEDNMERYMLFHKYFRQTGFEHKIEHFSAIIWNILFATNAISSFFYKKLNN